MPIEVGVWRINGAPEKIAFSALETEAKLEDILVQDVSLISPDLMLIGRQVATAFGTYIDMLGMDADGNLNVIELKRHKTPREVIAQALDYASWVQTLSYDDIADIYADANGDKQFEQGFADAFETSPPEKLNQSLEIVIVAAELDNASERIVNYLSNNFGVPINVVFFRHFKDGDNEYLTRTWLIDPKVSEIKATKAGTNKGGEPWNGRDYYVSYGDFDDGNMSWEDGRRFGFVVADGGLWYTRTLNTLTPGARIFVNIPQNGYVGVGTVVDTVVPAREFTVDVDGQKLNIYEAPLQGKYSPENVEDKKRCAYFVRVEWIKTLPKSQAYWEKGMYANQNTVTKLKNRFTLEKLAQHFSLDD